jgi:hypothetical protein
VDAVLDHPADPYTRRLVDAIPRPGWVPRRATAFSVLPTEAGELRSP